MSTSISQDSSSANAKMSVDTEWILSNPVIDNPIYDFFEEEVPHHIPMFDTDDHTYTYLIHSSCLTRPIKYSTLPEPSTNAQNDLADLDAATPLLLEGSASADAGLSQSDKIGSPSKQDLDAATPPLPEGSTGVNAGLSQNEKVESSSKPVDQDDPDVATPPPAATTPPEEFIHHVGAQHVIVVETGEDVAEKVLSKVISLAMNGSKSVYIQSTTGKLATMTLNETSTPSEITRHEGLFDIVSLTGSYMMEEVEGLRRWTGGLHLSSTADGIAFEGSVEGELIAASPVEVAVMTVTTDS